MSEILQIVGALGVGGVISSYLTLLWQNRNEDRRRHQDYKEQRYKCIIMLLHAHLNFATNVKVLNKHGYDIASPADLADLLNAELMNSYLYASEGFIAALRAFIDAPSDQARLRVAEEIRKDLWKLR